jgi:hypothetical protein
MNDADDEADEENQPGQLGCEDRRSRDRQRTENAEIAFIGEQRVADQQRHERHQQHRQTDHQHVIAEQRPSIRFGRRCHAQDDVTANQDPDDEEAERDHAADAADEEMLERVGTCFGKDAEVEHRAEEMPRQMPFGTRTPAMPS